MTIAIGAVMTEHIVTGRLQDQRLTGEPVRYPDNLEDARRAYPHSRSGAGRAAGGAD